MIASASSRDSPEPKSSGAEPIPPKLPQPRTTLVTRMPLPPSSRASIGRSYGVDFLRVVLRILKVVAVLLAVAFGASAVALAVESPQKQDDEQTEKSEKATGTRPARRAGQLRLKRAASAVV